VEGLLKSDIFFVITSVAIVIVALFVVAILVYLVLIMRDIKNISGRISEESKFFFEDLAILRANVKKDGKKVKHFLDFFANIYKRNTRSGVRKKRASSTTTKSKSIKSKK